LELPDSIQNHRTLVLIHVDCLMTQNETNETYYEDETLMAGRFILKGTFAYCKAEVTKRYKDLKYTKEVKKAPTKKELLKQMDVLKKQAFSENSSNKVLITSPSCNDTVHPDSKLSPSEGPNSKTLNEIKQIDDSPVRSESKSSQTETEKTETVIIGNKRSISTSISFISKKDLFHSLKK
jgi:hypothetical protein